MNFIELNNGVQMPVVGLGTWDLRGREGEESVLEAVGLGYRLIDTAQMYENERQVGNAINRCGVPREELFITTKIYRPNNSYRGAKSAIEVSLKELQLDYIDLVLLHEPYREAQEMYRAMKEAYRKGTIRAIGISNFNTRLYNDFVRDCNVIPAVNQVEAHVFFQQSELRLRMSEQGTHLQAWSPLAAGKNNLLANTILVVIGQKYKKTAAQIALRYLVQVGISVIPKSSHRNRMIENMDILNFQLTIEDMVRIRKLDQGQTLFGWY